MSTQDRGNDCEKEMLSLEPHLSQVAGVFIRGLKITQRRAFFSVLNTVQNKEIEIDGSSSSPAQWLISGSSLAATWGHDVTRFLWGL